MIATLLLVAATAVVVPPETHEIYIDKDGCRWIRPVPSKKKPVPKKPAPAASAASAPAPLFTKPKKPLYRWKEPAPDWEPLNCEPVPGTPTMAQEPPFTPVPGDSSPPTFETLAGPPTAPVTPPEEPCDCFAYGPPVYFEGPTFGSVFIAGLPPNVQAVPEPRIIVLLIAGFTAMLVVSRRRRAWHERELVDPWTRLGI